MLDSIINYNHNENIKKIQKVLDYTAIGAGIFLGYASGSDMQLQPEDLNYYLAFGPAIARGLLEGVVSSYDAYHENGIYSDSQGFMKNRPVRTTLAFSASAYGFVVGFFETLAGAFVGNLVGTNF